MLKPKSFIYTVSNSNQLFLKFPDKKDHKILNGKFSIDEDNNLVYEVDKRQHWYKKYNIPDKIHFQGNWELDSDHNLILDIRKERKLSEKKLRLRGKILKAEEDLFIFQIKSTPEFNTSNISYLRFRGFWRTDIFNRIVFEIKKLKSNNSLVFKNAWSVNKNNQITYEYEKLETKTKQRFILDGYWDIPGKNKLCYIVTKKVKTKHVKSLLNFNVFLETPNVYPAKGKIKYRVKIGLRNRREESLIALNGAWKYGRKFGLIFEMDYGRNKVRRIKFIAQLKIYKKDKLIFALYNSDNFSTGISITFLKHHPQIPNEDFELFLRLKHEGKTPRIDIGGKIKF